MPALVAGIHVYACAQEVVDGRDKPGHDEDENYPPGRLGGGAGGASAVVRPPAGV